MELLSQLYNEKIERLRAAYALETDTAVKFKLEHQIRETEEEMRRQGIVTASMERYKELKSEKTDLDLFLLYDQIDKDEIAKILKLTISGKFSFWPDPEARVTSEWLNDGESFLYRCKLLVVFIGGGKEPWNDRTLSKFLTQSNERKMQTILLVMNTAKRNPRPPFFLRDSLLIDFRNLSQDPCKFLSTEIEAILESIDLAAQRQEKRRK